MRVWELVSMPSICPGCATGCNIEVHTRARGLPAGAAREPGGQQALDVRRGPLRVPGGARPARLLADVGGKRALFDRALDEAARLLREALDADRGSVGVLFSAQATNEDTHALARLAIDELQVGTRTSAAGPPGWSDDILV